MDSGERKKREPPEVEDQPQLKRQNSFSPSSSLSLSSSFTETPNLDSSSIDPKDVGVILYQNRAMQIRIKELRMDIIAFEEKIRNLNMKQALYDETLSCVNRVWNQLNDNLQLLLGRVSFSNSFDELLLSREPAPTTAHEPPPTFLQLLIQRPEPLDETSELELDKELEARVEKTQQILTLIVEAIEREHANAEILANLLRNSDPQHKESALVQCNEQLERGKVHMQSTLNELHTRYHQLSMRVDHLSDQNLQYQHTIETLRKELEQTREDYEVERRRVIKLKDFPQPGVPVVPVSQSQNQTDNATHTTTTSSPMSPSPNLKEEEAKDAKQKDRADGLDAELADLQILAGSRMEEIKKLRGERTSMLKELTRLRNELDHLPIERVQTSAAYQQLMRQLSMLKDELEGAKNHIAQLQHEVAVLSTSRRSDREQIEGAEALKRRTLDKQIQELEAELSRVKAEKIEMQYKMEERMASMPSQKYIAELKLLLSTRETETKKYKEECEKLREAQRVFVQKEENMKNEKVEDIIHSKQLEINELHDKIRELNKTLDDMKHRERKWSDKEREYKIVIDGYQSSSKERRDVTDLRVSERRLRDSIEELRRENEELRRQLDKYQRATDNPANQIKEMEKKHQEEVKILRHDLEHKLAKADRHVKDLKTALDSQRQETEVLLAEIENISKAFEDMQAQNSRLLQQLAEKEDATTQILGESMKLKQQVAQARAEVQLVLERFTRMEDRYKAQTELLAKHEDKISQLHRQSAKASEDLYAATVVIENQKRAAREAAHACQEHRTQLEEAEKLYTEAKKRIEEAVADVERERERVKRLEEDKVSLKRKLERVTPRGGVSSPSIMEEELKLLKQKMRCSVCNDRMKDTVITKCFHVFCRECIRTNLEIRKRRCPGCAKAFSDSDVHNLYLGF
jgi:E3 ubiquitin-protein ligase BRE1